MKFTTSQSAGTLTLIGSGEMAPSMGKVHREVLSRIPGRVRAVFLDTPAGFELNADQISAKAVGYFERHLNTDLDVASFKVADDVTPAEVESALRKLRTANYIFAGPGSPTYAVRNWYNTLIWETVVRRLTSGGHLVLASAAAIAIGRHALPVYEIYKVGDPPHWVEGLDLLGTYGLELAIVPHWNNGEGGTHDTRYCFMGKPRLRILEEHLPDSASILGIDEYTACILDLANGVGQVIGAGQVTARNKGYERTWPAGAVFKLGQLQGIGPCQENGAETPTRASSQEKEDASYEQPSASDVQPDIRDDDLIDAAPFIELLVTVRAQLRNSEQWALADEIRERLSRLGIVLEDGPTGTTWRKD